MNRIARDTAHLWSALVLGPLWFSVLVTLWSTATGLIVTLIGIPLVWLTLVVAQRLGELEAAFARWALRADAAPPRRHEGWALMDRLGDPGIWRAQGYLMARWVLGFPLAVALLCTFSTGLGLLVLPAWYWSLPEGVDLGIANVDSPGLAVAMMPVGAAVLALWWWLTGVAAAGWRRVAEVLLPVAPGTPLPRLVPRLGRTVAVCLGLEALCLLLWALTGRTSAWPAWTALGLMLPVGLHLAAIAHGRAPARWRGVVLQAGIGAVALLACLGAWLIAGHGSFWPVWPALGIALGVGAHALRAAGAESEQRSIAPRLEQLTRTRAGVVDARDDELRRIERDLHDGAQARLVAVAMNLGLAEERLQRDPDGARELVAEAQEEARRAIRELRDLARGIAPPVLADRGLRAAVEALAATSPLPVRVDGDTPARPPATVERAAYFVAAEALANAAKHAGATHVIVTIGADRDTLRIAIADDGRGGANPSGSGLDGLRQRVEAIDGRLEVSSPSGGGTIIRASLPCASS